MSSIIDYKDIIQKTDAITRWLLLSLAAKAQNKKDIFLRNSMARCHALLESISLLYYNDSFHNGWILYRALLDRFVYLVYLEKTDSYEEFEAWSFVKSYEYNNSARSNEKFKRVLDDPFFEISKINTKKYYSLKENAKKFVKPDPESILKEIGLEFLYKYGYDYSSRHTHPMFEDGLLEFHSLTGLEPNPYKGYNHENLIKNSILINKTCQQEILNNLSFRFRKITYNYLDSIMSALEYNMDEFNIAVYKVMSAIENDISLFE